MAFSYSLDLNLPLNFVRFKLNDTDPLDYSFEDEEISYFITQLPTPYTNKDLLKICAMLLRQEIRKIALYNTKEIAGRDTVERTDVDSLKLALSMIEEEIKGGTVVLASPSYGGVNKGEVTSNRETDSIIPAKFYHGRVVEDEDLLRREFFIWR